MQIPLFVVLCVVSCIHNGSAMSGGAPEEATWEWLSEFQATYPSHYLKVVSEGEGNVTTGPQEEGRPKRLLQLGIKIMSLDSYLSLSNC